VQQKFIIVFAIGTIVVCVLCLPLLYYSVQICLLVTERSVPGAVRLADLSKVAIGGIGFFTYRFIIIRVTRPLHEWLNTEKDPEKREKLIERACESTNKVSFHLFALVWGYSVIKRCGWLPTLLGGNVSLD
jgi:hypothetical protein